MRAAHIIKITRISGAERHLLALLGGLRQHRIEPHLIMLAEPANPMEEMIAAALAAGITIHPLDLHFDFDPRILFQIVRLLRYLRPDLVHTHLIHGDTFGIPAAKMARVPLILSSRHNDDAFRHKMPLRLWNALLWQAVDAGIAISHSVARFCQEVEFAPAEKIHVIHYGVAPHWPDEENIASARILLREELGLGPEALLIGMVGRLIEQKGMNYGIEAFAAIADEFSEAHLVIAGDGPLRESLEALAKQRVPAAKVHFIGWRADSSKVFAALDIFLMPSLWEGFGLVLLEAMSWRIPVIATQVSAIPEIIIPNESGLLVPPENVAALAAALRLLLADRPLRRHIGLTGMDRMETHFSADQMIQQTAALYQLLHQKRHSAAK